MSKVRVVIPARYGSSRLPGKPLRLIASEPMIWHVWQRAQETGYDSIVVATDDERIADAVAAFGGEAVMTSPDHASGTERLAEVAEQKGWADSDIVVNLQGDEPLLDPALVRQVAQLLVDSADAGLATLVTPIHQVSDFLSPNVVKAVLDHEGSALYFSRAPIPFPRDDWSADMQEMPAGDYYRHIGMYAYRVGTLKAIPGLPVSPLEQLESLEQLRPLQSGIRICAGISEKAPAHGVDTEEDLARVHALMSEATETA